MTSHAVKSMLRAGVLRLRPARKTLANRAAFSSLFLSAVSVWHDTTAIRPGPGLDGSPTVWIRQNVGLDPVWARWAICGMATNKLGERRTVGELELAGACDEMPHPLRNPCGLAAKEETRAEHTERKRRIEEEGKKVGVERNCGLLQCVGSLCAVPCFFWDLLLRPRIPIHAGPVLTFCVSLAFLFKQCLRLLFFFVSSSFILSSRPTPSVACIPILL